MTSPAGSLLRRSLAAAALVVVSCAHAPASWRDRPAEATASGPPERVFVTGTHIPRRVDGRGIPATTSATRVYSREDLRRTGSPDVGEALHRLDPSL
jgi:hypothetical protein